MVRRVSAFVLACVIVGAPVGTAICQVVCQTHQTHEMGAMAGHLGHQSHGVGDGTAPVVNNDPNTCEHPSDTLVAVQQVLEVFSAPALVTVQSFALPGDMAVRAARASRIEHSPPGAVALVAQLRV